QALRFGPVCRGPGRGCTADVAVHCRGSGVLRPHVRLVWLGKFSPPGLSHTSPGLGICPGERLAIGPVLTLAGVCVDGYSLPAGRHTPAGCPGAMERAIFYLLSVDFGDNGSRICNASECDRSSDYPVDPWSSTDGI